MKKRNLNEDDFQKYYPYQDGTCHISNRQDVVDSYLENRLSEEEEEAFELHIFYCTECFKSIRLRRDIEEVAENRSRKSWILRVAAVFIIISFISMWFLSEMFLPKGYEYATLSEEEKVELLTAVRSKDVNVSNNSDKEFAQGADFLRNAESSKFILFINFDTDKVDSSIVHLKRGYQLAANDFQKNKCAYFIGKSYLMRNDRKTAQEWLQKVLETNAVAYRGKTKKILNYLSKTP